MAQLNCRCLIRRRLGGEYRFLHPFGVFKYRQHAALRLGDPGEMHALTSPILLLLRSHLVSLRRTLLSICTNEKRPSLGPVICYSNYVLRGVEPQDSSARVSNVMRRSRYIERQTSSLRSGTVRQTIIERGEAP